MPDDARRDRDLTRAIAAHERAIAARTGGAYARAEAAIRQALALYQATEGRRHPDVANALVELGAILDAREQPQKAAACHRRALTILGRANRDPDLIRLRIQARLALAWIDRGRGAYPAAERQAQAALAEARRRLPPRDPLVAAALNNLGVLRKAQGRYAEAAAYYQRTRRILSPRRDCDALATLEHNLGGIAHARGRHVEAEPHARRAVVLRQRLRGPRHPAVAADVAALAAVVESRGRFAEAARLYQRALKIFRRALGPGSLEVGLNLAGLAAVEQQRGRPTPARPLYVRSLAILTRHLGAVHPDVALTFNNLAVLERDAGNLPRARQLFRRAHRSFLRTVGPRHPHTRLADENRRALDRSRPRPHPTQGPRVTRR